MPTLSESLNKTPEDFPQILPFILIKFKMESASEMSEISGKVKLAIWLVTRNPIPYPVLREIQF